MRPTKLTAPALLSLLLAPAAMAAPAAEPLRPERDYHSFANVEDFRVRHVELDLATDFAARRLHGTAELALERLDPGARTIVLDTRSLDIDGVWLLGAGEGGTPLRFTVGETDGALGEPLRIELPEKGAAGELRVRIAYATRPEASGLQWLTPEQTAGRTHPFLFTQSQAIHARSWIPLQDTPQVRVTYGATIRTPKALRAVMSAEVEPGSGSEGPGGTAVHRFRMPQAIPSYLIALAVGRLEFRELGPRTGVYAEPAVLPSAAQEFADLEKMVETCEGLFGPYRWERYDLLILPPSFPFGGMENPRLSFITPTVIAGDRSLVALIAHELAHSWSGNLVTNATWRDFWLNEGFTTYLERRIVEALYGERREAMEAVLGLASLREELARLEPRDQVLAIDLRGRDPDDGMTEVAYEKGKLFLDWLEARFGRERLDAFLRGYFDHFAFQSITTERFLSHLEERLLAREPGRVSEAEVDAWIYRPGIPDSAVLPRSDAFVRVDEARSAWLEGRLPAARLPGRQWSTHEWLHFLDGLPERVPHERLAELDGAFGLTQVRNAEIAHSWLRVAVRQGYEPAWPRLEQYLTGIGRRKLIRPLYEELMKTPEGAERARRIYAKARPGYHPIAAASIDAIVNE